MGNLPFFYYDIIARIIPGGLVIAALGFAGVKLPLEWAWVFGGPEAWKTVVAALLCAGAAYVLGVLMEVLFSRPQDWLSSRAFRRAFRSYVWRRDWFAPTLSNPADYLHYRRHVWNWIILKGAQDPLAFAHAHRFQAEARLCSYSTLPALVFAVAAACHGRTCSFCWRPCSGFFWAGIILALALIPSAYAREYRGWVQVLVSADHFGFLWPAPRPKTGLYLIE